MGADVLRESILAVLRLAMNRIHFKNKGASAIENSLLISRISEERRSFLINLVESLAELPECHELVKKAIEDATKGTFVDSNWRMDIDMAQRSSLNLDPQVNFVCRLETSNGTQTLRMTPQMLEKLENELQKAVNASTKAKQVRV